MTHTPAPQPQPHLQTKETFITLYNPRLFTAEQVWDMVYEAVKSERERVLKALKKDLQTRFISSTNSWSKGRNSGLLECCNIIDEPLRSEEEMMMDEENKI